MVISKKIKFKLIQFCILIYIISSCVPQARLNKSQNGKLKNTNINDPQFNNQSSELYFSDGSASSFTSLNFNFDFNSVFFLKGQAIHNLVKFNTNKIYCLVVDFNQSSSKVLRARAIPNSSNNVQNGTIEWYLRIEPTQASVNNLVCGDTPVPSIAHQIQDINPSAMIPITSKTISLYEAANNNITNQVSTVSLNSLNLTINPKNNFSNPGNGGGLTCSNQSCIASGFSCCLNNKCVTDGATIPGSNPPASITSIVANNPSSFSNWPQYFYSCNQSPPVVTPPPVVPVDPNIAATQLFQTKKARYFCQQSDNSTNAKVLIQNVSTQVFDINTSTCTIPTNDIASTVAQVDNKREVWKICGCTIPATDIPTNQCPDFKFEVSKDSLGNVQSIFCLAPPPAIDAITKNLNVTVSGKNTTHRFFESGTGIAFDDLQSLAANGSQKIQEGQAFSYLDEANRTSPQGDDFNVNAVLGSMDITLTKALPAKAVTVNFDTNYIISANSGYSTPCPSCSPDAWFSSFSSAPSSQYGKGLQGLSYTTNRSVYGNNIGLGNYEDTIFGRACFVPVTMLPYSYSNNTDVKVQRMNRLKTQAALYINGYQRDWFGFNKGALIGSFDGVKWFAIGTGRRITATSNKLFLAINAPFADLSSNNDIVVSVILDNGLSVVADSNFDSTLALDDPRQNQAGSCQYWHQCNTDMECVSKLGWEYSCAETNVLTTNWPSFDIDANELSSNGKIQNSLIQSIQSYYSVGSQKRCIYRGAGAPCKTNYNTLPASLQKQLTCAPNYYCAKLDSGTFNSKLIREPINLSSTLYGKDADVLGRPSQFNTSTNSLPIEVISNLKDNLKSYSTNTNDFGLCRPGPFLAPTHLAKHSSGDSLRRSDLINGISNCDSKDIGDDRVMNCPVFDMNVDSLNYGNIILNPTPIEKSNQNMCGGSSVNTLNVFTGESSFKSIELERNQYSVILTPSIVKDACMRKPGSVCHTDLDCGPNRLHAEAASLLNPEYFGKTEAELNFWSEDLVCSQGVETVPLFGSVDFEKYDMGKNRCCRASGKDFTMYTQDNDMIYDTSGVNKSLNVAQLPKNDPKAIGRYSRYSIVDVKDSTYSIQGGTPYTQSPKVSKNVTPKAFQWKTIADTGRLTCCGGGWIRKFSDKTNDWTTDHLTVNYGNFKCLNYDSPLALEQPNIDEVPARNYVMDYTHFCEDPKSDGCIQKEFVFNPGVDNIVNPKNKTLIPDTNILKTFPFDKLQGKTLDLSLTSLSQDIPYYPIPYTGFTDQITKNIITDTGLTDRLLPYIVYPNTVVTADITEKNYGNGVSFLLPSYIGGIKNIVSVSIAYYVTDTNGNIQQFAAPVNISDRFFKSGSGAVVTKSAATIGLNDCLTNTTNNPASDGNWITESVNGGIWCLEKRSTGELVFHARGNQVTADAPAAGASWRYAGIEIEFRKMGTTDYIYAPSNPKSIAPSDHLGLVDGNDNYYLTKLGRLELLGIPQIFYEPLYCNSDKSQLVPGLYKNMTTRTQMETNPSVFTYDKTINTNRTLSQIYMPVSQGLTDDSNPNAKIMYSDQISLQPVFAANEFKCCLELGNKSSTAAQCCSNFANKDGLCALPSGTDISVYFNRFVSGDGVGSSQPGGGLLDTDFIPETGEVAITTSSEAKLVALGNAYCDSNKIRRGVAFGYYDGEPNTGSILQGTGTTKKERYSIIDSIGDENPSTNPDGALFDQSYRWNHHYYCQ